MAVAVDGKLTVALDVNISDELLKEGIAREFINRMQNLRKDMEFEVTDKIIVSVQQHEEITTALNQHKSYICAEILAQDLLIVDTVADTKTIEINDITINVSINKV